MLEPGDKIVSYGFSGRLFDKFVQKYGRLPTEFDPDWLEMVHMSKYRVLAVPDVQPGKCANCGSSKADGRKYIDIGLEISWYGALFLCSLCLEDVARNVGLFDEIEEELQVAKDKLLDRKFLLERGEFLQNELTHVFEEVKEYLDTVGVRPSEPVPYAVGRTVVEPYQEPATEATGKGDKPANEAKSRTSKSTPSPRLEDLLGLAERSESKS